MIRTWNRFLLVGAGLAFGAASLFVLELPLKWVIAYFSIVLLVALAFYVRDIRLFCLGLFVFAVPLYIQDTLWAFPDYEVLIDGTLISAAHTDRLIVFLSDLPLLVLFLAWFGRMVFRSQEKIRFPKSSLPILLFLCWCVLTVVKSRSLILSSLSFIYFVKYFLIFLYFANNIRTKKDIQVVAAMLVLGVAIQGAVCFAQWKTGVSMTALGQPIIPEKEEYVLYRAEDELFRATGTVGISNQEALYFEMTLPVVLSLMIIPARGLKKGIVLLCFLIGTFGLIICFSKAGWGGFLATTLLVFLMLRYGRLISTRLAVLASLIVLIVIAGGSAYVMTNETLLAPESLKTRPNTYQIALRIIKENPILGVGLNNSAAVQWHDKYDPYDENIRFFSTGTVYPIHNFYGILAAEVGLVGFVLFMWFIFAHLKRGLSLIRQGDGLAVMLTIGFLAGVCGFLMHAWVDICYIEVTFSLLFMYAGMICAFSNMQLSGGGEVQAEVLRTGGQGI